MITAECEERKALAIKAREDAIKRAVTADKQDYEEALAQAIEDIRHTVDVERGATAQLIRLRRMTLEAAFG